MIYKQHFMDMSRLTLLLLVTLSSCTSPRYSSEDAAALSGKEGNDRVSDERQETNGLPTDRIDATVPEKSSVDRLQNNENVETNANDSSTDRVATAGSSAEETGPVPPPNSSTKEAGSVPPRDSSAEETDSSNPIDITPEEPELPKDFEWANDLIGRYAMRVDSFRTDASFLLVPQTEILLANFSWDGNRVVLGLQVCSWTSDWNSTRVGQSYQIARPQSIPKVELDVSYDGENWETLLKLHNIGFQAEPLVPCSPGQSVPADSSQVWIRSGMCTCYDNENIPYSPDDCRVDDPDDDRNPGISLQLNGAVDNQLYYIWVRGYHYINGTINRDGKHTANESLDSEKEALLSCLNDSPLTCVPSEASGCRPEVNSVRFVRLLSTTSSGNEWTCEDVLNDLDTLLPSPSSSANVSLEDC